MLTWISDRKDSEMERMYSTEKNGERKGKGRRKAHAAAVRVKDRYC